MYKQAVRQIKYTVETTHSVRHRYAAEAAEAADDAAAAAEDAAQDVEKMREAAAASEAAWRWSQVANLLYVCTCDGVNIVAGTTSAAAKYQCALRSFLCLLWIYTCSARASAALLYATDMHLCTRGGGN